jgi:hypothetical protein
MKRIVIALLVLTIAMSLFVACTPKPLQLKNRADVIVDYYSSLEDTTPKSLNDEDAKQLIVHLENASDEGFKFFSMPNLAISVGRRTLLYNSSTGEIIENYGKKNEVYYFLGKEDRLAVNEILGEYIHMKSSDADEKPWEKPPLAIEGEGIQVAVMEGRAPGEDSFTLSENHVTELLTYLQNLPDGTNYLCNCLPDVSITIDGRTFSYHSDSGVLTEKVGDKDSHYYVGDNREAINNILKQYITLGHH